MPRHGTFTRVVHHELRVLSADRSLWVIGALLAALTGYASFNGLAQTGLRDRAQVETREAELKAAGALRAQLRAVMAGEQTPTAWNNPTNPSLVADGMAVRYALLPSAPLAPLALGQSDLYPDTYQITTRSRVEFMYDSEIENPWNLLMGRFDLAFVFTYLLPLFVFAWSYNCLTNEREQGTLRMLLSQPIGLRTVAAAKLCVRGLLLVTASLALPIAMLLWCRPEARSTASLQLLGGGIVLIAGYTLFWLTLALVVDSASRSSARSALVLTSCWVTLVLVIPVLMNLTAARVSPSPSRAELATQTRLITIHSLKELSKSFATDYDHTATPEELLPKQGRFEVPQRLRAFALASQQLDERIEGALDAFERQLAGQQSVVDRLGVLSPAVLVYEGLTALAGQDVRRYQAFQGQASALHGRWKQFFMPRVLDGYAISDADLDRLPSWTWQEPSQSSLLGDTSLRGLQLLLAALLLALLAYRRLGRYSVT